MTKGRAGKAKKDLDEDAAPRAAETEARAIDVKIKSAEGGEALVPGNLELLKKMQDERWETYDWVDAEVYTIPPLSLLPEGYFVLVRKNERTVLTYHV